MPYLLLDPDEDLDYDLDYKKAGDDWLGSDTITVSGWAIFPAGPVLTRLAFTDTTTKVFVKGLTAGQIYRLTNSITTAALRKRDSTITLRCGDR